jgi:hypothetical protein
MSTIVPPSLVLCPSVHDVGVRQLVPLLYVGKSCHRHERFRVTYPPGGATGVAMEVNVDIVTGVNLDNIPPPS